MIDYYNITVALVIGFLLGIDRERLTQKTYAGIRTFILVSLLGYLSSIMFTTTGSKEISALTSIFVGGLILVAYFDSTKKGNTGITTEFLIFIVFVLGFLSGFSETVNLSLLVSVLVLMVTGFKDTLHRLSKKFLTQEEWISTIKFLALSIGVMVALPQKLEISFLKEYDFLEPLAIIEISNVGWLVFLIAGINFITYFLSKIYGQKSSFLIAALAGLISSTAVTAHSSSEYRINKKSIHIKNILIANSTSTFKAFLLSITILFNENYFTPVFLFICFLLLLLASLLVKKNDQSSDNINKINNDIKPFELNEIIKFTLFFLILLPILKILAQLPAGLIVGSFFGGSMDIDGVLVTLVTVDSDMVWLATIATILGGFFAKSIIATTSGGVRLGIKISSYFLLCCIIPAGIWLILSLF
jgi:uncharacterized membrane protein (DUF4010 family)